MFACFGIFDDATYQILPKIFLTCCSTCSHLRFLLILFLQHFPHKLINIIDKLINIDHTVSILINLLNKFSKTLGLSQFLIADQIAQLFLVYEAIVVFVKLFEDLFKLLFGKLCVYFCAECDELVILEVAGLVEVDFSKDLFSYLFGLQGTVNFFISLLNLIEVQHTIFIRIKLLKLFLQPYLLLRGTEIVMDHVNHNCLKFVIVVNFDKVLQRFV